MDKFDSLKKEIERILPESPIDFELKHSELVLKWVLKLKPDADESLKIAALGHDIDRAVHKITEKDLKDYSKINEFKKEHGLRSAKILNDLLKKYGYNPQIIERVNKLVENHEFGGDEDSDVLMEADSLAFFDYNIPSVLKRNGYERTKKKIRFMYDRLSLKGKKLVKEMKFQDKEIEKIVKEASS
jgi:hypothetical protein